MSLRYSKQLYPANFVREWLDRPKEDAVGDFGDTLFLLVELDDATGELANGLKAASTLSGERLAATEDALSFATTVGPSGALASTARKKDASSAPGTITDMLSRADHFVVPLRKRPQGGSPFAGRVSVGRARNTDIVLRHPSVSKFHAWFQRDADGCFFIADADSTNYTLLNGRTLAARESTRVEAGDTVRFGLVGTILCDAVTLWDAIRKTQ